MSDSASNSNPYSEAPDGGPSDVGQATPPSGLNSKQIYNVVTDTVGGMNARKVDNLFQLKVVAISALLATPLGALIGYLNADADARLEMTLMGAVGVGFLGVVLGVFGSGIYLMIYRAVQHAQGKHD